jgi:hypothetical protein
VQKGRSNAYSEYFLSKINSLFYQYITTVYLPNHALSNLPDSSYTTIMPARAINEFYQIVGIVPGLATGTEQMRQVTVLCDKHKQSGYSPNGWKYSEEDIRDIDDWLAQNRTS